MAWSCPKPKLCHVRKKKLVGLWLTDWPYECMIMFQASAFTCQRKKRNSDGTLKGLWRDSEWLTATSTVRPSRVPPASSPLKTNTPRTSRAPRVCGRIPTLQGPQGLPESVVWLNLIEFDRTDLTHTPPVPDSRRPTPDSHGLFPTPHLNWNEQPLWTKLNITSTM